MRRILITAIGGDVACGIIRCLLDGCKTDQLYGYDIDLFTPYMDYFTIIEIAPRYTEKRYISFMKRFIIQHKITHFIPVTETEILIADANRKFFNEYGVKLLINNPEAIRICTSKYLTAKILIENGIPVPKTFLAENYSGGLVFPFIMKADYGNGGSSVHIIHNQEEWRRARKDGMVCQQKIGGENEYTIAVFSDGENINTIILKRKLGLGNGNNLSGLSVEVCCCDIPEIKRISERIAKVLHIIGCINIQMKEEDGNYYVFEINPRLSSTVGFRYKMGFEDTIWWINMIDGVKEFPSFYPPVGRIGIKVTDDKILAFEGK